MIQTEYRTMQPNGLLRVRVVDGTPTAADVFSFWTKSWKRGGYARIYGPDAEPRVVVTPAEAKKLFIGWGGRPQDFDAPAPIVKAARPATIPVATFFGTRWDGPKLETRTVGKVTVGADGAAHWDSALDSVLAGSTLYDRRTGTPLDPARGAEFIRQLPYIFSDPHFCAEVEETVVKYSEDQPRDDHGRWTGDGGGSPSAASSGVIDGKTLAGKLASNGGFTVNPQTGKDQTTGFAASIGGHEHAPGGNLSPGEIESYQTQNADVLGKSGNYLGGWRDGSTDYLDVSQVSPTLEQASALARASGQQALFDLATQETYYRTSSGNYAKH